MIKHLENEKDFETITKLDKNVVVDFYADWCAPCKMLGRNFQSIEDDFPSITILKVNVDDFQAIASKFFVTSIPYLVCYKDGQRIDFSVNGRKQSDILGALDEETLSNVLKETF